MTQRTNLRLEKKLDKAIFEQFLMFILEKWRISSGEHKGEPFQFKDAPYLYEIITDTFPFQVTLKSAQARLSEIHLARVVWNAIRKKGNQLYTMPAGEQMQQFVDSRAREAIMNSEFLQKYITGSLNLKKFSLNRNQIYFRGVQKRRQIITVDVSSLTADEVDEYEEGTLYTLDKRLGAAKNPERFYFSTPSFHGTGVSLFYYGSEAYGERGSDQRVWTIQCESCGQWNEDLIWEENVVDLNETDIKSTYYTPNAIVVCRYCKKQIDRLSSRAEWVAKYPSNSDYCHGRHVSKLFAPTANLNQMLLDSRNPLKEQEFNNSDLGRPYEPKGSRLTDANLDAIRGNHQIYIKSDNKTFLGADIGNAIHAVVSMYDQNNLLKVVGVAELDDWDDLKLYARDFNALVTVVDANPDKDEAIDFQKSRDDVWLAYYIQQMESTTDQIKADFDDQIVHIHRTLMMMLVSDMVVNKNLILPIDIRRIRDFYEHMKSPIKALKQDAVGNWIPFYPKTKNPDHYFHATLYNLVASMLKPKPAIFRLVNMRRR